MESFHWTDHPPSPENRLECKTPVERYICHRKSVPELQRSRVIYIKPLSEAGENLWKNPEPDFERIYFETDDESFRNSSDWSSNSSDEFKNFPGSGGDSRIDRFRVTDGTGTDASHRISSSRERIHEIFQRNRRLRRQFFAGYQCEDGKSAGGRFPIVRPASSGLGSLETLTSHSNRSSSTSDGREKIANGGRFSPVVLERGRKLDPCRRKIGGYYQSLPNVADEFPEEPGGLRDQLQAPQLVLTSMKSLPTINRVSDADWIDCCDPREMRGRNGGSENSRKSADRSSTGSTMIPSVYGPIPYS